VGRQPQVQLTGDPQRVPRVGRLARPFAPDAPRSARRDGVYFDPLAPYLGSRLDDLPDIPTVIESGVPGFTSDTWNAISAPPKTPAAIISKLNLAINAALEAPEIKARYRQLHLLAGGGSPADMAKLKKEETERWTKVIRDAGIEPQ